MEFRVIRFHSCVTSVKQRYINVCHRIQNSTFPLLLIYLNARKNKCSRKKKQVQPQEKRLHSKKIINNVVVFHQMLATQRHSAGPTRRLYVDNYNPKRIFRPPSTPLKPMKAMARRDAVMRAIGTPSNDFGTLANSNCSRRPAKRTMARRKPIPVDTA